MHGGAIGSGAPYGKRNGSYRHGTATKEAMAKARELRAWLRVVRGSLRDLD
jgi:hypothetical protein